MLLLQIMSGGWVMINTKHKDRLFRKLFGDEKNKENLLSLYNALNDTHYNNVDDLTITTIDDVIYLGMKNDVSCAIDNRMALYEHQSSFNPNMPLRGFMYFGKLYNKEIKQKGYNIYGSKLIKIPTPQYYVFYNGTEDYPDRTVLRLSDAFQIQQEENDFEWTAIMLNINYGKNKILMDRCQILKEYAILVSKIRKYQKIYTNLEIAITTAIDECIEENILKNFLLEHKSEVIDMCLTEYNEEEVMEMFRKESYEDGLREGEIKGRREGEIKGRREGEINALIKLYKDGTLSLEQVSERLNISIENLKEYL